MRKIYLIIISLLIFVVGVSGCTTSSTQNTTQNKYPDLEIRNPTIGYYGGTGDNNGHITANVVNNGVNTYRNIDVKITCYNEQHEVLGSTKYGIASLAPKADAGIIIQGGKVTSKKIYSVDMAIENATKV